MLLHVNPLLFLLALPPWQSASQLSPPFPIITHMRNAETPGGRARAAGVPPVPAAPPRQRFAGDDGHWRIFVFRDKSICLTWHLLITLCSKINGTDRGREQAHDAKKTTSKSTKTYFKRVCWVVFGQIIKADFRRRETEDLTVFPPHQSTA